MKKQPPPTPPEVKGLRLNHVQAICSKCGQHAQWGILTKEGFICDAHSNKPKKRTKK